MNRLMAIVLALAVLAPVTTVSDATAAQTPPDEQNPWLCYDDVGWERPCSATEEFDRCVWAADAAAQECYESGDGFWHDAGCYAQHHIDFLACELEFIKDFIF